CSKSCARSGSPTRKRDYRLLSCANCGIPVERQFAELRRRKLGKAFCSSECWYAHAQRENNPVWTGGQHERINSDYRKWRKAVLERDFYECANCHSAERLDRKSTRLNSSHVKSSYAVFC